jgi:hypothetical protein
MAAASHLDWLKNLLDSLATGYPPRGVDKTAYIDGWFACKDKLLRYAKEDDKKTRRKGNSK